MKNKQEDTKISLCPHCNCMTHTIEGLCGKCMNTKIKPDWEKEFDEEFCKGNEWVAPNMKGSYIKDFIRDLLAKKEAEYEKEKDIAQFIAHELEKEHIERLKLQHREELIGLRRERRDAQFKCDQEDHECRMALREVKSYNTAVDEINKAITNLLEQKGKI